MHELGIVFYIIRDVKEVAARNGADHISTVVLSLGEVSTVVPDYLQDCWKWAVEREEMMRGCTLRIETVPAVTYCGSCHREYGTVAHGRTCPHCGSGDTWLVRGNEVEIKEIEV